MRQDQCLGGYKGPKKRFAVVENELRLRERKDVKEHTGPKKSAMGCKSWDSVWSQQEFSSDHVLKMFCTVQICLFTYKQPSKDSLVRGNASISYSQAPIH